MDSLNIRFRKCELNQIYYSNPQSIGHYVSLDSFRIKEAKADMDARITFDEFMKKYSDAEVRKNLLLVESNYPDYQKNKITEISDFDTVRSHHSIRINQTTTGVKKSLKGTWVYDYWPGSKWTSTSISAFYIEQDFVSQPVPDTWARLIQYADCMVDTSTDIFYDNAEKQRSRGNRTVQRQKIDDFIQFVNSSTGFPELPAMKEYDEKLYEEYRIKLDYWEKKRFGRTDSLRKVNPRFDILLKTAVDEALKSGASWDNFEEYVARYYSKKTALELKRNRVVVGACSQDDSPRWHAFNIALLSAETINWEIFLRSHLNILNDKFDRVAESSFARDRRETYLRELEVLNIDAVDLLLGTTLRFENASRHHYFGSIDRVGRALAESEQKDLVEKKLLDMITDCNLDTYNRLLAYYTFTHYNHHLTDPEKKAINKQKLIDAIHTLPYCVKTEKNN